MSNYVYAFPDITEREINDVPFPDGSDITVMVVARRQRKAKGVMISNVEL